MDISHALSRPLVITACPWRLVRLQAELERKYIEQGAKLKKDFEAKLDEARRTAQEVRTHTATLQKRHRRTPEPPFRLSLTSSTFLVIGELPKTLFAPARSRPPAPPRSRWRSAWT